MDYPVINDHGGHVAAYIMRAERLDRAGLRVRFAGRCDSACTVYLGLPRACVTRGVSFGFHLPFGAKAKGNEAARRYLLSAYPAWVRAWLKEEGGLTASVKRMGYSYASKHLPTC